MTVEEARKKAEEVGLKCVIYGDENALINDQLPKVDTVLSDDGVVILYTEGTEMEMNAKVPNVIGDSPTNAIKKILNSNLNVSIKGIFGDDHVDCHVVSQSVSADEYVLPGTVIELEFLYEEDIE